MKCSFQPYSCLSCVSTPVNTQHVYVTGGKVSFFSETPVKKTSMRIPRKYVLGF
ncbi:MAG: hypothetical protein IPN36_06900 [Bacteroidetes bacterium]|nr:hypothetical protein [Bacteroidota bacterium]